MKKLLQINTVINSGSTGHIAEGIGQLAIKNGWESYIAYGRNDRPSSSTKIKIETKWSIYLHVLKTRLFDRHGFGSKKATKKFIKQIETIKPDIIHLHNIHGYYLNIEALFHYLKVTNIPIVWTLHDCWSFTGHCSHFEYIKCKKWIKLCNHCPQKKNYPASFFLDNSTKNYLDKKRLFTSVSNMTIISVSQWINDLLSNSFLSKYPKKIIPNGIDTALFSPQNNCQIREKLNLKESDFVILGVATVWNERKGLMDFIKLANLIDTNTKIVLVGLSEHQKKNLPKNIIPLTRTESQKELAELYSAANVVLNLSYEESFGMTTVEGFACGTPSIVYNCTASPELLTNKTGFIVQAGNLDELIYAINTIRKNTKSYYSSFCIERAITFYDKNKQFANYINLYDDILSNNS